MDALIVLKNNLKNNSWNVHPSFKLDENEAKKIIAEVERVEMEFYAIGVLRRTISEDDGK